MPELDLSRRIVYSVDGMTGIAPRRHIYRRDAGVDLALDVYLPPRTASTARAPALFFVHGGPIPPAMLPPNEWGMFQSYGQLAAASGLAGIVVNHRLFAPTAYPTAEADVIAAVDFVRTSGAVPEVDPDRVGIWVFSGGGPLLTWCLRERPPFVRCLLAFYAFLDLRDVVPSPNAEQVERLRRLSPAAHVAAGAPPVFIARAGHHGFDIEDDDETSRDIVDRAVAFVKRELARPRIGSETATR
jgi:acetyl esterase/lipase